MKMESSDRNYVGLLGNWFKPQYIECSCELAACPLPSELSKL